MAKKKEKIPPDTDPTPAAIEEVYANPPRVHSGAARIPIPDYMKVTPARLKTIQEEQTLYAQVSNTRAELSDRERMIARGRQMVEIAQGNLALQKKKKHRKGQPHQRDVEYDRLAEGYALQGLYHLAVRYARNPVLKAQYRCIVKALSRDDSEKCRCPRETHTIDDVEIETSPRFIQDKIISIPHGGELVPLVLCRKCGHANVRAADGMAAQLAPMQDAAMQAARVSAGQVPLRIPNFHASVVLKKEAA